MSDSGDEGADSALSGSGDLCHVNEHLRDLLTDKTLPPQERELNRGFYAYRQAKLQLQIAILDKKEMAQSDETARSETSVLSGNLERLLQKDSDREERRTTARRWELSREWEAITPDELKPAVEAVRETFETSCWQASQSTMKLCHAALHPATAKDLIRPDSEDLTPYKRFLVAILGPRVQQLFLGSDHPAPVIFKSYLDLLEAALKFVVRAEFGELFEIAKARADLLSIHPVEWTHRHLEILVFKLKFTARGWIIEVCEDPDASRVTGSRDDLFSGNWRAPRLIHMRPSGNTPYDAGSAWAREGLATSMELLEALSTRLAMFVGFGLDKIAGAAHVEFVKQDSAKPTVSKQAESYRQRPSTPNFHPVTGTQVSDAWRGLHDEFRVLAEEELTLAPRNTGDRWLRAYVDYKDKTVDCGLWHVSEGVGEGFRQRFEVSATRAGIALGSVLAGEPGDVWLHHVFLDLLAHSSKLLFSATKEGGIIVRACEASAIYCARLEKQALIEGRKTSDASTAAPKPTSPASADPENARTVPSNNGRREAIVRMLQNPQGKKTISTSQTMEYFEVSARTIYRWVGEGKLSWGGRRGSITIESIQRLERRRSRKRSGS